MTGPGVPTRGREAAVDLAGAQSSRVAPGADAAERVDEVDAGAAISTRRELTVIDVRFTPTASVARYTATPV